MSRPFPRSYPLTVPRQRRYLFSRPFVDTGRLVVLKKYQIEKKNIIKVWQKFDLSVVSCQQFDFHQVLK